MREQQLGAAASPLAGRRVQLRQAVASGGCSASPPPQFATACFILIPRPSVFSAGLRHACLGDALHTRSLKARRVKASAGSWDPSGSLRTSGLQSSPTNTYSSTTAGMANHSGEGQRELGETTFSQRCHHRESPMYPAPATCVSADPGYTFRGPRCTSPQTHLLQLTAAS